MWGERAAIRIAVMGAAPGTADIDIAIMTDTAVGGVVIIVDIGAVTGTDITITCMPDPAPPLSSPRFSFSA